jgi:hypothetical protein
MLVAAAVVAMVACVGAGAADDGLVAEWHFDEGAGGVLVDSSGNGNDGTIYGATWTEGVSGGALSFDGDCGYVDCGDDASLNIKDGESLTIECWMKKLPSLQYAKLVNKGQTWLGTPKNAGYSLSFVTISGGHSSDSIRFSVSDGGDTGIYCEYPDSNLNESKWYHITGVLDKNNQKIYLYINGVEVDNADIPVDFGSLETNMPVGIGALHRGMFGPTDGYFNGTIDEVRIYNRALTADEIREHYYGYGLVAEWNFDEGAGSVLHDSSGNGNDGTIHGATWADGKIGGALRFDGSNDYVDCGNDDSLSWGSADYSICAWVKRAGDFGYVNVIVGKHVGWGDYRGWYLRFGIPGGTNKLEFNNNYDSFWNGNGVVKSDEEYTDQDWHYICGVLDGGNNKVRLYVDAVEIENDAGSNTYNIDNSASLRIGAKSNGEYFNGVIDEVRIYNRALTADEIRAHYYGHTPPYLTITSPAPDTTTHTPTITIAGTASDPSGIASVTVNGALASGAADWSAWSAEVALAVGENAITAIATNSTGGSTTKAINATYTPLTDPPEVTLATTLSDSYTVSEPITIGVSLDNTGTTPADATIAVTTTSGFSDTKTVTIPEDSTHSESFNIGSLSSGSYTATVNLYVDSALLDSSSMPFTVRDPAAVKIADDSAESLKRTAIDEFDEMAGIPASASSSMIAEFGFDALQKYVGDNLGTATDTVQNEDSSGSISDSDVQTITDDANGTINTIESGITDRVSRPIIQKLNTIPDVNLREDINIFELKESVSAIVFEKIKDAFEDIFTDVLKDHVVKPLLTDGEEAKVEMRDCEFDSYLESTPFSLTTDNKTKVTQRFNVGCGAISSVTESKALCTVGPYSVPLVGEFNYTVTLREEKNKFEELGKLGAWGKYVIGALVVTGVVLTLLVSVLGTGGAILLPFISAIPHITSFLTTVIHTMIPIAKSFLLVGMFATVSIIAPDVTLQHDTTLDTVEDIISDIAASGACSVSVSKVSSTASYIDQPSSVTVKLNNDEPTTVQPITEVMVFSPDGRIIDIRRQDPQIAPHSAAEIATNLHIPSKSGTYRVLGMVHAGGVATSIVQQGMTVTEPSLKVNLSTDSRIYSPGDTIEITANFTNNEESEIGNLTYVIEVINTTTVDADMMVLAARSSQTRTVSFTPTDEGSYVATATLLLGFTEIASETIGFTVGSGVGLVINAVAEDLYPPEADVTFNVTIENIGTVHTDSTINITTFDELIDFYEVYTSEIPVSLDAGASITMQPTVLPNAPPGIYRTIITAGNYSVQSVGYTVTANGTLFTLLDTDKLYYNLTDVVNINITANDVMFDATNASVDVSVTCPSGIVTNPAVSGSGGNYVTVFNPASNGTYEIAAASQKTGFKTYSDETFVIVGARSTLDANLSTNNITLNQTVFFECNITNEHGVPIEDVIATMTGCGTDVTKLSDGDGIAEFVITPDTTGRISFTAEKGGYTGYTSTIYVFDEPDSTVIGDLDGDDRITSADAAIALRMAVRGEYADAADVSGDGRVTSLDALMILQAAA